jgi:hypothetical protein
MNPDVTQLMTGMQNVHRLDPFLCSIKKTPVPSSRPEMSMPPRADIVRDGCEAATAKRLVLDDIEHGGMLVSGRGGMRP